MTLPLMVYVALGAVAVLVLSTVGLAAHSVLYGVGCVTSRPRFVPLLALIVTLAAVIMQALPPILDASINPVRPRLAAEAGAEADANASYAAVSEEAASLHGALVIVDMHADPLFMTYRNYTERSDVAHTDLPRLLQGNVAIQGFGIVTKVPALMNFEKNSNRTDLMGMLAVAQRWPMASWSSLTERAVFQAKRLHSIVQESDGKMTMLLSGKDVAKFLKNRDRPNHARVGAFLGIEGVHALDGILNNTHVLFEHGVRMMGIAHFFDNTFGGSAHGETKYGLTEDGRKLIGLMEELKMIVDVAHSSASVLDDVLEMATRPVVASHTGVKGTCDSLRNLSDDHLRRIAKGGGLVGIAYFPQAVCGSDVADIVRAIRYTVNLIGIEHVGLGSDFDGAVSVPFDTAHLDILTDALLRDSFSRSEIAAIMGGNSAKFLQTYLP